MNSRYTRFDEPVVTSYRTEWWASRFFGLILVLGLGLMAYGLYIVAPKVLIALVLWFFISIPVGIGVGKWLER